MSLGARYSNVLISVIHNALKKRFSPLAISSDYRDLAKKYPTLGNYLKRGGRSQWTLDFKDKKAVREFNAALLWANFSLRLEIPLNTLIPPVRLVFVAVL
ncbi:hypothetical protein HK101_008450 [Irineochytrium annulatum]|nr:hypothetical protein HK101_008450 [Irineochytrium annulatum]